MALQDIDSVNLPPTTLDIIPITIMGARTFEGLFTIEDVQTGVTVLTSYDIHDRAKLLVYTYIKNNSYNVRVTFLRLFIDNYINVTDFKLILYVDGYYYSLTTGMQLGGYSVGVESRLMICDSPLIDIAQEPTWNMLFMPNKGTFVPNNNNYIESAILSTNSGEQIMTITFNEYGRQKLQNITIGYVDFCAFIPASACAIMPDTGYCLTSFKSKSKMYVAHD